MLDSVAAAKEPTSSPDTKESSMTAAEALAIAWTGIEALGGMGRARLFHSPTTGRVWVEFKATEYTIANGLAPLAMPEMELKP